MSPVTELIPVSDYVPAGEIHLSYNLHDTSRSLSEKLKYGKELLADRIISTLEEGYVTISDMPMLARTIDILTEDDNTTSPQSLLEQLADKYIEAEIDE